MTREGVITALAIMGGIFYVLLLATGIGWGASNLIVDGRFTHKAQYVVFPLCLILLVISMFTLLAVAAS